MARHRNRRADGSGHELDSGKILVNVGNARQNYHKDQAWPPLTQILQTCRSSSPAVPLESARKLCGISRRRNRKSPFLISMMRRAMPSPRKPVRDMSIVRLIDGQWTEPKSINNDNWKIAGCPVNGPSVGALGNSLAIAWFSMPEGEGQVNLIFSSDGGATLGNPIRVDEGSAIGRVDVVLMNDTSAMVSWMQGGMIKAKKVNVNGTKEPSTVIASSSDSRSSGFPQMTKSKDQLIFAWTDDKDRTIKTASLSL